MTKKLKKMQRKIEKLKKRLAEAEEKRKEELRKELQLHSRASSFSEVLRSTLGDPRMSWNWNKKKKRRWS